MADLTGQVTFTPEEIATFPQGPQGADGADGAQGEQGVPGSPGPKGDPGSGGSSSGLVYDTTGVVNAAPLLQAAIDSGQRWIVIPPGIFFANSPVFYDQQDGNATLFIHAPGVVFKAGTGLPTVAEFDAHMTSKGRPTGCRFFLFPSTLRSALSGGVVTCSSKNVPGSQTFPAARNGISPHLVIDAGTFDASGIPAYNGGFVFGNVGGATELRSVHMSSARTLLSWAGYVDGNKISNCGGWGATNMTATNDAALLYQITNGDAVYVHGCKTDNYVLCTSLYACNGALIESTVGGGHRIEFSHGIVILANHTETASNISVVPRNIYTIINSDVVIDGSFDYLADSHPTGGAIYLDDSGAEGKHSRVELRNYTGRHWLSTSDPGPGFAIFLNRMNDRSRIRCRSCFVVMSPTGTYATTFGETGMSIGGNAMNEPTLVAAVAKGRDVIGSGDFQIAKAKDTVMATGQNNPMTIEVTGIGNLAGLYRSRQHVTPTFFDAEQMAMGTLASGQVYSYAAALCNTLPAGSVQYGKATAEWTQTAPVGGAHGFEMYLPTGAQGATLAIWRKTGVGVLTAPDRYVLIPVGSGAGRFVDTGVNINKIPWLSSPPGPSTVNNTVNALYLNGSAI